MSNARKTYPVLNKNTITKYILDLKDQYNKIYHQCTQHKLTIGNIWNNSQEFRKNFGNIKDIGLYICTIEQNLKMTTNNNLPQPYIYNIHKYIESLSRIEFTKFKRNFCFWLIAYNRLGICDESIFNTAVPGDLSTTDETNKYSSIISDRYYNKNIRDIVSLASEALYLYINFLNNTINSCQYGLLINMYNNYILNKKILRSRGRLRRKYLKICIDSERCDKYIDWSNIVEVIREQKLDIYRSYELIILSINEYLKSMVSTISIICAHEQNILYQNWIDSTYNTLCDVIEECAAANDYEKFMNIYNQLKKSTPNYSSLYINGLIESIYQKFPLVAKYIKSASICENIYYMHEKTDRWLFLYCKQNNELTKAYITTIYTDRKFTIMTVCECGCGSSCILKTMNAFVIDDVIYIDRSDILKQVMYLQSCIEKCVNNKLFPFSVFNLEFIANTDYSDPVPIKFNSDIFIGKKNKYNNGTNQLGLTSPSLNKYIFNSIYSDGITESSYREIKEKHIAKYIKGYMNLIDLLYVLNIDIYNNCDEYVCLD